MSDSPRTDAFYYHEGLQDVLWSPRCPVLRERTIHEDIEFARQLERELIQKALDAKVLAKANADNAHELEERIRELERSQEPAQSSATVPTHPNGLWMVYYEDASVDPEIFFGEGAERAARERFAVAKQSWSCHLLSRWPETGSPTDRTGDGHG